MQNMAFIEGVLPLHHPVIAHPPVTRVERAGLDSKSERMKGMARAQNLARGRSSRKISPTNRSRRGNRR